MDLFIGLVVVFLLLVWFGIRDYRARRSNKEWLQVKELTLERLSQYEGDQKAFVEEQALHVCYVCDLIARSGILDAKRNQIFARHALLTLEMLEAFGFVSEPDIEDENTSETC